MRRNRILSTSRIITIPRQFFNFCFSEPMQYCYLNPKCFMFAAECYIIFTTLFHSQSRCSFRTYRNTHYFLLSPSLHPLFAPSSIHSSRNTLLNFLLSFLPPFVPPFLHLSLSPSYLPSLLPSLPNNDINPFLLSSLPTSRPPFIVNLPNSLIPSISLL